MASGGSREPSRQSQSGQPPPGRSGAPAARTAPGELGQMGRLDWANRLRSCFIEPGAETAVAEIAREGASRKTNHFATNTRVVYRMLCQLHW